MPSKKSEAKSSSTQSTIPEAKPSRPKKAVSVDPGDVAAINRGLGLETPAASTATANNPYRPRRR